MKIQLELDDFRFVNTKAESLGEIRWLVVEIDGRQFSVWRTMDPYPFRHPDIDKQFDRLLIQQMEVMLRKIFVDAIKAIPDGANIPNPT